MTRTTAEQEGWIAARRIIEAVGVFEAERIADHLKADTYARGFNARIAVEQIVSPDRKQ